MREKKLYKIITFHTTTDAMAMESQCMGSGIPGRLIPVPREITAGCGLAWRIPVQEYGVYAEKMEELKVNYDQITEVWI